MVFTKQHQQRLLDKYVTENPSATALEMQAYISGVEEGILQHIEITKVQKTFSEGKDLYAGGISSIFIIEVFFNNRRLEYRSFNNETDTNKELIKLKETYKDKKYMFYKGELKPC